MSKKIITVLASFSLLSSLTSPAFAGVGQDVIPDFVGSKVQAKMGLYLNIPFTGGLKTRQQKGMKYGFAMGLDRPQVGSSMMGARYSFKTDVIKFNFNAKGFNSFQVGRQDIYTLRHTRLGAVEGESNMSNIWLGIAGVGLAVVGVTALSGKDDCPYGEITTKPEGGCAHAPIP